MRNFRVRCTLIIKLAVICFIVVLVCKNVNIKNFLEQQNRFGMMQLSQTIIIGTIKKSNEMIKPIEMIKLNKRIKPKKPTQAYFSIPEEDIVQYLVPYNNKTSEADACPINIFKGAPVIPYSETKNIDWPKFSALFAKLTLISAGGEWQPDDCVSRFLVAIIIPVQNRESNLREFLLNIHPFLQKQFIYYKIYVIELAPKLTWNKGLVYNAGFIEIMKDRSFPCIILHDVDSLPKYRNNIYACTTDPRLMLVSRDPEEKKQEYDEYFGGAIAMLSEHYKLINGFSNRFFQWGGEDDDFYNRVKNVGLLQVMRFATSISCYRSLPHNVAKKSKDRYKILKEGKHLFHEGLNSTKYKVIRRLNESLCTRIVVSYD